jgi:quinol monooxygenase YgiN
MTGASLAPLERVRRLAEACPAGRRSIPGTAGAPAPILTRTFLRLAIAALVACGAPQALDAQDDPTLYVVRYVEAAPASQGQVAAMLRQLAEASRKEGAVRYEVLQRTTPVNQFVILEIWKDQPALDRHDAAAHTRQFRGDVGPLLVAPIDERFCVATIAATLREGRGGLYVVTHVDVGPGGRPASLPVLEVYAAQSRKDPGNLRVDIVHQKDKTNHFTVMEVWADQKSFDDHQLAAHTRTFRTQIGPFMGALYDQRSYKPL